MFEEDDDFLLDDIPPLTINPQTVINPANTVLPNSHQPPQNTASLFELRFDHLPDDQFDSNPTSKLLPPSPSLPTNNQPQHPGHSQLIPQPFTPSRHTIPKRRSITSPHRTPLRSSAHQQSGTKDQPDAVKADDEPLHISLASLDVTKQPSPISPSNEFIASLNSKNLSVRTSTTSQPSTPKLTPNHSKSTYFETSGRKDSDFTQTNSPSNTDDELIQNDVDMTDAMSSDSLVLPSIHFTSNHRSRDYKQSQYQSHHLTSNPPSPNFQSHCAQLNRSSHHISSEYDLNSSTPKLTRSPSPGHYVRPTSGHFASKSNQKHHDSMKGVQSHYNSTHHDNHFDNNYNHNRTNHANRSHKFPSIDTVSHSQDLDILSNAPSMYHDASVHTYNTYNSYNSTIHNLPLPTHLIDPDFPLIDGAPVVLKLSPRNHLKYHNKPANPFQHPHNTNSNSSTTGNNQSITSSPAQNNSLQTHPITIDKIEIEPQYVPLHNSSAATDSLSVDLRTLQNSLFNENTHFPQFKPPPTLRTQTRDISQRPSLHDSSSHPATMTSPTRNRYSSPGRSTHTSPVRHSLHPQRPTSPISPYPRQTISSPTRRTTMASPSRLTMSTRQTIASPTRTLTFNSSQQSVQNHSTISTRSTLREEPSYQDSYGVPRTGRQSIRASSPTPSYRSAISSIPSNPSLPQHQLTTSSKIPTTTRLNSPNPSNRNTSLRLSSPTCPLSPSSRQLLVPPIGSPRHQAYEPPPPPPQRHRAFGSVVATHSQPQQNPTSRLASPTRLSSPTRSSQLSTSRAIPASLQSTSRLHLPTAPSQPSQTSSHPNKSQPTHSQPRLQSPTRQSHNTALFASPTTLPSPPARLSSPTRPSNPMTPQTPTKTTSHLRTPSSLTSPNRTSTRISSTMSSHSTAIPNDNAISNRTTLPSPTRSSRPTSPQPLHLSSLPSPLRNPSSAPNPTPSSPRMSSPSTRIVTDSSISSRLPSPTPSHRPSITQYSLNQPSPRLPPPPPLAPSLRHSSPTPSKQPVPPRSPSFPRRTDDNDHTRASPRATPSRLPRPDNNNTPNPRRSLQRDFSPSPSLRPSINTPSQQSQQPINQLQPQTSPNIPSTATKAVAATADDLSNTLTFAQFFQLNNTNNNNNNKHSVVISPPVQSPHSSTDEQPSFPNVPRGVVIRGRSKSKQPPESETLSPKTATNPPTQNHTSTRSDEPSSDAVLDVNDISTNQNVFRGRSDVLGNYF